MNPNLGSALNKDKGLFKIRVLGQTFGQFHNGKGSVPNWCYGQFKIEFGQAIRRLEVLRLTQEITIVTPN